MQTILIVFHLFLALGLIGLILIQHGKGADAGAAFGSGASSTVFGAQGSASFLTRTTAVLAALFFITSMTLAYFAAQTREPTGIMDSMPQPTEQAKRDANKAAQAPAASEVPVIPAAEPATEVPAVPKAEAPAPVPQTETKE
jgi:preprotein translocase subunit SecG